MTTRLRRLAVVKIAIKIIAYGISESFGIKPITMPSATPRASCFGESKPRTVLLNDVQMEVKNFIGLVRVNDDHVKCM